MAVTNQAGYNVAIPITTLTGDPDLTNQTDVEGIAPGQLDVFNDEATTQNIVLQQLDGTNRTFRIPADSVRVFYNVAFAKIITSGTGTIAEVTAYYERRKRTP